MLIPSEYTFFFSISCIIYVYFGYLLVLKAINLFLSRKVKKDQITPFVTILIPAHNEEWEILNTVENKLYELDYPPNKLEVIVIDDGSSDKTVERLNTIEDERLKIIKINERKGKTNALNEGLKAATGEIIVFSDANTLYKKDAIRKLVSNFADERVGYVTGRMVTIKKEGCLISEGTSAYILYENFLRKRETAVGSIIGCDGGIDAVRKKLFHPIDPQMIPDFFIPLKVIEQGYRVVYEPDAVSKERAQEITTSEFKMRVRVIVRSFNAIFHMRHLLNFSQYPLFSFQLFSHKILRYLIPFLQMTLFLANLKLLGHSYFYNIFFIGQICFYLSAMYGYIIMTRGSRPQKLFYIPYYFNLVNFASLVAVVEYLSGERYVVWEPRKGVNIGTGMNIYNHFRNQLATVFKNYAAWPYWACIIGLFTYLYGPTIKWMYSRFTAVDTYYSHGFLIPFISAFLIWQKKERLKELQVDHSWWGLVLIFTVLVVHLFCMVFFVLSPSAFTIPLFIIGICLFFYGKEITKLLLFPLLFLFFMCPPPLMVIGKIAEPMKLNVSRVSANIVSSFGIPVFREGFYIDTIKGQLLVGNPCSGLRSLITFLALGALLAYLAKTTPIKKFFLFTLSVPIAFLANIIRVVFLVVVTNYRGISATIPGSIAHDTSGFLVFAFGCIALLGFERMVEWKR
jgi:exosortase